MSGAGYYILKAVIKPLSLLPLGFHRRAGRFIGWLAGDVFRYRRDVVMTNLSRSFPDLRYWDLKSVCRKFYLHLGTLIGETIWFGSSTPEKLRREGIVRIGNQELLDRIYAEGKSAFVMTAHVGNWELLGGIISYYGDKPLAFTEDNICVTYRELSSPAWQRLMSENRIAPLKDKEHFDGMVETFRILRHAIRNRDRQLFYMFITDQFPYSAASSVPVSDFMHQPTLSMNGAPALARKLHMPVIYMGMPVGEDGNYRMTFTLIAEDASAMSEREILDKYYELLQRDIEAQPWNYLWTHKRWK